MKPLKQLTQTESNQVSGAGKRVIQQTSQVVYAKDKVDPRAPVDGIYPPPALPEF